MDRLAECAASRGIRHDRALTRYEVKQHDFRMLRPIREQRFRPNRDSA
jgi:hypothetical protein